MPRLQLTKSVNPGSGGCIPKGLGGWYVKYTLQIFR